MRFGAWLMLLILLSPLQARAAQPRWTPAPGDLRSFDQRAPIPIDLGAERPSEIRSWITELRRSLIPGVDRFPGGEIEFFINFAVAEAGAVEQRPLFRFRYGTENGGYRAYSIVPIGDADGDGLADLALHVGGELPAELVVLLDRGGAFEARTTGPLPAGTALTPELEIVAAEPAGATGIDASVRRVLARWRPAERRFAGDGLVWVIGARASIREAVRAGARIVAEVEGGSAIRLVPVPAEEARAAGWLPVEVDGVRGWVSARVVEAASPEERR